MGVIRAFIAVSLAEEVTRGLVRTLEDLKQRAPVGSVRWTPPGNIHLTLKFLGDVSESNIPAITRCLQTEVARHPVFAITAADLGAFPSLRRPRVIWIGLQAPPQLDVLQRGLEAEMERLGYPRDERPFAPHLTLGRVRKEAGPAELSNLSGVLERVRVGVLGTTRVESVHLYRSVLSPGGSIYTRLFSAPLGGPAA